MQNGEKFLWIICWATLSGLVIFLLSLGIGSIWFSKDAALERSGEEAPVVPTQKDAVLEHPREEPPVVAPQMSERTEEQEDKAVAVPLSDLIDHQSPKPFTQTKKIAILIDDLGWDLQIVKRLLRIDAPLTFAILPEARYSSTVAEEVRALHREALLHLPMEPYGYPQIDPGSGALLESMSIEELKASVQRSLALLPQVVGVNNHMGSKLTENMRVMEVVLQMLKERNLFFVDSKTSVHSVAYETAKRLGLKSAYRHVFLDNEQRTEAVSQQITKLAKIAQHNGGAIGIGHPHLTTVQALEQMIPQLKKTGFVIVPVSQLLQ